MYKIQKNLFRRKEEKEEKGDETRDLRYDDIIDIMIQRMWMADKL